jgi:hypothetical protein
MTDEIAKATAQPLETKPKKRQKLLPPKNEEKKIKKTLEQY